MNKYICLLLLILRLPPAYGQHNIQPLKVGDQCPDFLLGNIINYTSSGLKLSHFKGKLLVLDFWATWCGSCIMGMPKMDSLQQKFSDQLIVLPVTSEDKEKASRFLATNHLVKELKLPSIVNDTLLKQYFPHKVIPHEVWIDKQGKVIAITGAAEVNEQNIKAALAGTLKLDERKNIELKKLAPLMFDRFGDGFRLDPGYIKYQSMMLDYIPGALGVLGGYQKLEDKIWVGYYNTPIDKLYAYSFADGFERLYNTNFYLWQPARTILEVADSSLFLHWPGKPYQTYSDEEKKGKAFTFEMIIPQTDSANFKKYIIRDLNQYFGNRYGIEGALEKRTVSCWVLKRTNNKDLLKTNAQKPEISYKENVRSNDQQLHLQNYPIRMMMFYFVTRSFTHQPYPFIDETGYTANVDIDISTNLQDPLSVSRALQKYGLEIVLEKRAIDMVVIKDKDK